MQTDGSGTTHRYGFVPLPVVRIQLRPRIGQILSIDLHDPRVLSHTKRRIISCIRRQVISSGVALQVKQQGIGLSEGVLTDSPHRSE
jgi:hypothetical protein